MRPQPPDSVLGDVSGELLAGDTEEEHAYDLVGLPDPSGYLLAEDLSGATALVVPQSQPFREAHLEKKIKMKTSIKL